MYQDNTSAITIVQDVVYNGRTKHIDIRLKHLREAVKLGAILLKYVSTHDQISDILTKGLPESQHHRLCSVLQSGGNPEEE